MDQEQIVTEARAALHRMHDLVYAAHQRCLELTTVGVRGFSESPIGMSHGPFSEINVVRSGFENLVQQGQALKARVIELEEALSKAGAAS